MVAVSTWYKGLVSTSALEQRDEHTEEEDDEEREEDQAADLPDAVGAVALHFARASVNHHLVDLLVQPVSPCVDGQQDMLESDSRIVCRDVIDSLLVAADVMAHVAGDD